APFVSGGLKPVWVRVIPAKLGKGLENSGGVVTRPPLRPAVESHSGSATLVPVAAAGLGGIGPLSSGTPSTPAPGVTLGSVRTSMFARYGLTGSLELTPWAEAWFTEVTVRASANTSIAIPERQLVRKPLSLNVVRLKIFIACSFCRALLLSVKDARPN